MKIVHLTSSRFFGGPERQMLELAKELDDEIETTFVSFSEDDRCQSFLNEARGFGFQSHSLFYDTPHIFDATRELEEYLNEIAADILCCHGYKANLLGLWAARKACIPVIAVSRGWTAECWRVRFYEWLDRRVLRRMDQIVCVSEGQAERVRGVGVAIKKVTVVHNAIRTERFQSPHATQYHHKLESLFPDPPALIIGAAGRLSPEKGFDTLVAAAQQVVEQRNDVGFVLFGDGVLRNSLNDQILALGMEKRFHLAGFCNELDRYMPHFDLFVQSSHTEGLPNVLLEAAAAGVPVVATDVGGTAEVVAEGKTGLLVPPGNASSLADGIRSLLKDASLRHDMARVAPNHVAKNFTFEQQAAGYRSLFDFLPFQKPQGQA